ncbi:MAG: DUF4399 domain-containing protein [Chloroflexi bacterium]|nr:DUF4399 domain-containing protein [Chloroflexota bacterium]
MKSMKRMILSRRNICAIALTSLVVALLLIGACAPPAAPSPTAPPATQPPVTTPPPSPAPAPAPTLTINSPVVNASLAPGSVTVSVNVGNFRLAPPGQTNVAGQGHLHYYKDVEIPTTPGKAAVTAPGTYKVDPGTTMTWDNLTPGTHTFGVQLVNNNHTPLEPPVTAKVTVTVTAPSTPTTTPSPAPAPAPAPTLTITSPAANASLPPGSVTVSVNVGNLQLVPPGQTNVAGQGHLHYYLDVEIPTTPGKGAVTAPGTYKADPGTSIVWDNLSAGTHTFGVQLVNNNHTPLEPPVTAKVTITITATTTQQPTTPPPTTPPPGGGVDYNY